MGVHPSLSVVVPTHNRPERVRALLGSLERVGGPRVDRVVVVDDSAHPEDLRSAFPDLPLDHVILGERVFISRAKNLGWRRTDTDLVYFIDDDNILAPSTLEGPRDVMAADPSVGAVVPAVLYQRQPDLVWVYATPLARGRWGHELVGHNGPRQPSLEGLLMDTDALPNASLVRRAALEDIGGFREDLVVNSSGDAALRLKRAGWKVRAYTGAFIYHDVDPPGEFGYWARHGVADPERVYYEVRDWFLLMQSIHRGEPLFPWRATYHALGFLLPNGTTYLLRRGARGRASFRNLLTGYLSGMRLASRHV